MSDLREIFLQPECCADEHSGRLWCEDDAPVDCEDDDGNEIPWTRYVRADLHDSLAAENAALKAQLAYAASAGDECAIEVESLRSRLAEAEGDRDAGWKAFYALREQVGRDRYPGLTNIVRTADSAKRLELSSRGMW